MGQADFTSNGTGTSDTTFNLPKDVAIDRGNGKLYVADYSNNRVLRYVYPVTGNQPAAELVFGQRDFASSVSGITQNTLNNPTGVEVDSTGRLWVADRANHRVLWFNAAYAIGANQPDADGVLGQPDFVTNAAATTVNGMNGPWDMAADNAGTIFVADMANNRVLRFDNAAGKANGADADGVLGQPDFVSNGAALSQSGMDWPRGVCLFYTSLFVADRTNARVLRFDNAVGKADGADADGVLGQPDFITNTKTVTQSGMDASSRVVVDGSGRLYVSDGWINDRILIFNDAVNKANGADADNVLGQADFVSSGAGLAQDRLSMDSSGGGMAVDSLTSSLFVGDDNNNRVVNFFDSVATPEINLRSGTTYIPDGGTYDFGNRDTCGDTTATFTIENPGGSGLVLGGTPVIVIGGANADQFAVVVQPATPVASKGSSEFQLVFDPTETGAKTATISIANNDGDEDPFDLTITGTATACSTPDDGGGCFIATAAYGSSLEPHVQVLREFRDRFLLTTSMGRDFVECYYTYSPPIGTFISKNDGIRILVRWCLFPLIVMSSVALHCGIVTALVLFVCFLSLTVVLLYQVRRKIVHQ